MFSNQVLKSPMTPRRPECKSGAFLNANCSNLTLIGQKVFATGTVSNQVLKSSMTFRRPEQESGALFYANGFNFNLCNWTVIGNFLLQE